MILSLFLIDNVELLWRASRASRLMSMEPNLSNEEKKKYAYLCLEYAQRAVAADDTNWTGASVFGLFRQPLNLSFFFSSS